MSFLRTQHSRCEGKGAINLVRFSFTCPRPVLAGAGTLQREKLLLTTIKESASESVYHLSSHLSLLLWHLIQTLASCLLTFLTCGHESLVFIFSLLRKFESYKLDSKFLSLYSFSSLSLISLSVFYDANFLSVCLVSFRDNSHQEMNFIGLRNELLSLLHSFYFWERERKEKEPGAVGAKLLRIEF